MLVFPLPCQCEFSGGVQLINHTVYTHYACDNHLYKFFKADLNFCRWDVKFRGVQVARCCFMMMCSGKVIEVNGLYLEYVRAEVAQRYDDSIIVIIVF